MLLLTGVLCILPVLGGAPPSEKPAAPQPIRLQDKLETLNLDTKGWTDDFIDMILEALHQVIQDQGLDPVDLPTEEVSFSETILGITWHGSAKVYNGKFRGLSTIHRAGNTDFTMDGITLKLLATLALNDASAGYDAKAEFMGISVGAGADVDISSVEVYLEAEMPLVAGAHLTLTQFQITNIGHISVDVHGLGPLDWILDILVEAIGNSIKGWLADIIEGPIRDLIQGLLDDYVPDIPGLL